MTNRSVTASLVHIREGALQAVEQVEALMDEMGLLKRRTVAGTLNPDRVLRSIEFDREGAPEGTGGNKP
jgi:hypothetical protein